MDSIIAELKKFEHVLHRHIEKSMPKTEKGKLFYVQVTVLRFLKNNDENAVCQKDLEDHLKIRSSSATKLLQRMEDAGFVRRETMDTDLRKKRIIMTDKAKKTLERCFAPLETLSVEIEKGITEEEKAIFLGVLNKLSDNTSEFFQNYKLPFQEELC